MCWLQRCTYLAAFLLALSITSIIAARITGPTNKLAQNAVYDRLWIESSPYLWDRIACGRLGICGVHHLKLEDDVGRQTTPNCDHRSHNEWLDRSASSRKQAVPKKNRNSNAENCKGRQRRLRSVPEFISKHAPLIHLHSEEEFWPSDIREHISHMFVTVNGGILETAEIWDLDTLHNLSRYKGNVALHSEDNIESWPGWLHSRGSIPSSVDYSKHDLKDESTSRTILFDGDTHEPSTSKELKARFNDGKDRAACHSRLFDPTAKVLNMDRCGHKADGNGYSRAPAVLIIADRGSGVVDAYWFFFYSYNQGPKAFGLRFGNHVGDWEHCMIRFENGIPQTVSLSERRGVKEHTWAEVEKHGGRLVVYAAAGSHAMYAHPGTQAHPLPFGLLNDMTEDGPLWDPSLNKYAYHYNHKLRTMEDTIEVDILQERSQSSLVPAACNPDAPTSWFHYGGRWGDELYSLADPRQWRLWGQYHFAAGPLGPKFDALHRTGKLKLPERGPRIRGRFDLGS